MKNQYIKYINAIIQNRLETMPREMEIISLNLLFPLPMDHKQTNKTIIKQFHNIQSKNKNSYKINKSRITLQQKNSYSVTRLATNQFSGPYYEHVYMYITNSLIYLQRTQPYSLQIVHFKSSSILVLVLFQINTSPYTKVGTTINTHFLSHPHKHTHISYNCSPKLHSQKSSAHRPLNPLFWFTLNPTLQLFCSTINEPVLHRFPASSFQFPETLLLVSNN